MTKQVQEDSAAKETLHPQNKSGMLNSALMKLSGMSIEDLSHFLNDTLAQVGHEGDGAPDASGSNQASLNMHPSSASAMKESVKEDLGLIFGDGEDLSEDLKTSVSTLFEAALETRLTLEREAIIEETNEKLDEAYNQLAEEMSDKLDSYLDHVIESWMSDNEVAIESSLRNELAEDFISGLKTLFSEHFIDVPESKVDVVEELASRVEDLQSRLDITIAEKAELKNEVLESRKNDVVNSMCEGLALTQTDKLRSLVENVDFTGDIDDFTNKVNTIKKNLVSENTNNQKTTGILTEESDVDAAAGSNSQMVLSPDIQRYKDAISRSTRR